MLRRVYDLNSICKQSEMKHAWCKRSIFTSLCFLKNTGKKQNARKANNAIIAGMNEWTGKTCIRFKRRTNEKDYVVFALRRLEAVSVICYEIILSNHELVCLNEIEKNGWRN